MNELIFAIAMSCYNPKIENKTPYPWNADDQSCLQTAMNNCKKLYPKSPCLKTFIKTGERDYRAICAKEV